MATRSATRAAHLALFVVVVVVVVVVVFVFVVVVVVVVVDSVTYPVCVLLLRLLFQQRSKLSRLFPFSSVV